MSAWLCFWLIATPLAARAVDAGLPVDQPGKFAFQAPAGWILKTVPNAPYPIACKVDGDTVVASIGVDIDQTAGDLKAWVEASLAKNKIQFAEFNPQVGEAEPFKTTAGIQGFRASLGLTANGRNLEFVNYFFAGRDDAKIVVTCTTNAENSTQLMPIFEAAMKTFLPR